MTGEFDSGYVEVPGATVSNGTEANWPEPIIETVHVKWVAVEGPRLCVRCGHGHYGWSNGTGFAPHWGRCGNPACACKSLQLKDSA